MLGSGTREYKVRGSCSILALLVASEKSQIHSTGVAFSFSKLLESRAFFTNYFRSRSRQSCVKNHLGFARFSTPGSSSPKSVEASNSSVSSRKTKPFTRTRCSNRGWQVPFIPFPILQKSQWNRTTGTHLRRGISPGIYLGKWTRLWRARITRVE